MQQSEYRACFDPSAENALNFHPFNSIQQKGRYYSGRIIPSCFYEEQFTKNNFHMKHWCRAASNFFRKSTSFLFTNKASRFYF